MRKSESDREIGYSAVRSEKWWCGTWCTWCGNLGRSGSSGGMLAQENFLVGVQFPLSSAAVYHQMLFIYMIQQGGCKYKISDPVIHTKIEPL
jgi:hypothetical protein